jgi:hypothetical protein
MADPITIGVMAGIAIAGSIASATVQGVAAKNAAKAQSDAAKAEGRMRRAEGKQNARQMRKAHSRELASQFVRFGVAGVDASSGTSLDVLAANAGEFELDAITKERFGSNAFELASHKASSARRAGKLGVASAAIGGLAESAQAGLSGYSAHQATKGSMPSSSSQAPRPTR